MYCLVQTDSQLISDDIPNIKPQQNIPLIEFTDIDNDGQIDMLFYHNTSIYYYLNMHDSLNLKNYDDSQFLCKA